MNIDGRQNRLEEPGATRQGAYGSWVPEGIVIGLAVVVAVMLIASVAAGAVWFQGRGDDTAATVEPTNGLDEGFGESAPPTSEPTDFELLACPAGTDQVICEAAEYVQTARQKPFKTFPEVELLESATFTDALLEDYDEGRVDLEHAELAFKGLGMIEPDLSLFDEFRKVLSVSVVGFYDPETGRLVVRGEDLNLYVRSVLVHELVHALDDQWFDLDREYEDDEQAYGFAAIAEGNATRVDEAWEAQLGSDERAQLASDRSSAFSLEDLQQFRSLPSAIIELQTSPYVDGPLFLGAAASDEDDIDALLVDPPTTSERILHPEVSEEADPQLAVELPERSGVVDDGKLGEIVVRQLFGAQAAEGWEGDSYVVWEDGDKACVAVQVVVETEQDRDELSVELDRWVLEIPERSSSLVVEPGVFGLNFSNCA